jgi:WW domain-containing oxidoreductase
MSKYVLCRFRIHFGGIHIGAHFNSGCFNYVVYVTIGATSGIGVETARVLALRGVHVVMAVRNMAAGREVKETILRNNSTAKIDMMELDLSSMDSVRKFTSQFNSRNLPLNILM